MNNTVQRIEKALDVGGYYGAFEKLRTELYSASRHQTYGRIQFFANAPVAVSSGEREILHFGVDQLPFLEEITGRMEAEIAKPEYRIYRSRALETVIADLAADDDRFPKAIKGTADLVVRGTDADRVLAGMRAYASLCQGPPAVLAEAHQSVLVFTCTAEEAVRRAEAAKPPPKRAAPEKVALKMVLGRIKKLRKEVARVHEIVVHYSASSDRQNLPTSYFDPIPPVPTDSPEALSQFLQYCLVRTHPTPAKDLVNDVIKTLERPDVTRSVIEEALRVAQVGEIMES